VIVRDQDVLGLQVPVDDSRLVDGVQARRHLPGDLPEQRLGDRAVVPEEVAEAAPLDVLHDHVVNGAPLVLRGVHVVGADHVLVADLAAHLPLAQEALEEAGAPQEVGMDDLDRDPFADVESGDVLRDLGEMDRPHSARAELGDEPVGPQ
jgi:hypothetical protein